jgi:hypothetical protein
VVGVPATGAFEAVAVGAVNIPRFASIVSSLGVQIAKVWHWYDAWLEVVRAHVRERPAEYR